MARELRVNTNNKGPGVFLVGCPDSFTGWLYRIPDAKRAFVLIDTVCDEEFTLPLCATINSEILPLLVLMMVLLLKMLVVQESKVNNTKM